MKILSFSDATIFNPHYWAAADRVKARCGKRGDLEPPWLKVRRPCGCAAVAWDERRGGAELGDDVVEAHRFCDFEPNSLNYSGLAAVATLAPQRDCRERFSPPCPASRPIAIGTKDHLNVQ
jgi:hypothetical protein